MKNIIIPLILIAFLLNSCAASTGSRYGKTENRTENSSKTGKKELKEDFDLTHYKTSIDIEDTASVSDNLENEQIWYNFPSKDSLTQETPQTSVLIPGFRVLVFTSDEQEQAEYVKADVYFKTKKNTYLVFEPPFYKVKAGDFTKQSQASDFAFKLNQLGFLEAKVIRDTVNIYKQ